jgi:hypothetical protein
MLRASSRQPNPWISSVGEAFLANKITQVQWREYVSERRRDEWDVGAYETIEPSFNTRTTGLDLPLSTTSSERSKMETTMVTAPRKKRHSPASFMSLPRALVHLIFTFTVVGEWGMTLHTLACISRDWYALAWDMASAAKLRVVTIDWTIKENAIASRHNFLALRNKLTSQRAHLRELCIDTNGPPAAMVIIWSVAFANAPLLEVLRISNGDTWAWIGPIVRAASRLCPRLRSLGLPYGCFNRPPTTPALEGALGVMLKSLPQWKPFGGLRNLDLKMPLQSLNSSRSIDHPTWATRYVKELAKNCPNLETAFGGRAGEQFVDQQWYIDLDTWEQFCASCTQLTAFDMAVVPFATSFFEVFGRYAKPKLTGLTLGSPPTH